jgi:hypothetical protein
VDWGGEEVKEDHEGGKEKVVIEKGLLNVVVEEK